MTKKELIDLFNKAAFANNSLYGNEQIIDFDLNKSEPADKNYNGYEKRAARLFVKLNQGSSAILLYIENNELYVSGQNYPIEPFLIKNDMSKLYFDLFMKALSLSYESQIQEITEKNEFYRDRLEKRKECCKEKDKIIEKNNEIIDTYKKYHCDEFLQFFQLRDKLVDYMYNPFEKKNESQQNDDDLPFK